MELLAERENTELLGDRLERLSLVGERSEVE